MSALLAILVVVVLLLAAALQLKARRRIACWLLAVFPALACLAYVRDLILGPQGLGMAASESDRKQFFAALVLFVVSVFAALRPQWRWLFWIEWILNAIACGVLVYLVFFWKVFS